MGYLNDGRSLPSDHTALNRTFRIALILKGLDGVLEFVGGALLLFVTPRQIGGLAGLLTQHELSEDPHDLIANALLHFTNGLTGGATLFGAIYLLLHGAVKIVLVVAILRNRLWAYPWLIAFLTVFIVYQGYRLVVGYSVGLTLLTMFDIVIVALTIREYALRRQHDRPRPTADPVVDA